MGDKMDPPKNSRDPRQQKVPNTVINPAVMPSTFATEENQNHKKIPIPPFPKPKITKTPEQTNTNNTTSKNNNNSGNTYM